LIPGSFVLLDSGKEMCRLVSHRESIFARGMIKRCKKILCFICLESCGCHLPADSPHRGLRTIAYSQLAKDMLDMLFDCFVADLQRCRDLLVCEPMRYLLKHFA